MLEGALKGLLGEGLEGIELTAPEMETAQRGVRETFIAATEEELYGYCTQFLIQGEALDAETPERRDAVAGYLNRCDRRGHCGQRCTSTHGTLAPYSATQ